MDVSIYTNWLELSHELAGPILLNCTHRKGGAIDERLQKFLCISRCCAPISFDHITTRVHISGRKLPKMNIGQ
jgi:hypothetical protein